MKIPDPKLGAVDVRPVDQQYSNLNLEDGTTALTRGIGALGAGIEHVQNVNEERAKRAREKAIAAATDAGFAQAQEFTTNQMDGYDEPDEAGQQEIGPTGAEDGPLSAPVKGKHVEGFLDSRGNDAYVKAADTTKKLQKFYDSLITSAPNEETRTQLARRIDALKATVHSRIAVHEGDQLRVAELASSNSLQQSTIRTAATLYNDDEKVKPFIDDALASIKRVSLPEEYESKKTDFLSKVSKAMIGKYVAAGDLEGAQKRLTTDSNVLGDDAAPLQEIITRKVKAAEKDAAEIASQTIMGEVAVKARNTFGFIEEKDENKLRDAADARYPKDREEAKKVAETWINDEGQRRQAIVKNWRQQAQSLRVGGMKFRNMPTEMKDNLTKYDPDYVLSVQAHELAEARHFKVERDGTARERAEAKAKQAQIDTEYFYTLKKAVSDDPKVDPEKVLQDFIVMKSKSGQNVMVTPSMEAHGKFEAADALKKTETKEGQTELRTEKSDQDDLEKSLRNFYKVKGKPTDEKMINDQLVNAMEMRRQETKDGKPPPIAELRAKMLSKVEVEVPGRLWGTNTVLKPQVELVKPNPKKTLSPKQQKAYDWAISNPGADADAILKKLGVK